MTIVHGKWKIRHASLPLHSADVTADNVVFDLVSDAVIDCQRGTVRSDCDNRGPDLV